MADDNIYDMIMDLLNKSDLISVRIISPTEDDMAKINKLYDLGYVPSRTHTIPFGAPESRVSCLIEIGKKLEDLK